jgi:uroporphyrinogen III methyltransferase/synthase
MSPTRALEGLRILVTRPKHQADQLTSRLKNLGGEIVAIPMIAIAPPDSWEPLDNALKTLERYEWILFTSVNAVEACLGRLEALGKNAQDLRARRLAAIGPSTAYALTQKGLKPEFCPSNFVGEGLVAEFPGYPQLKGVHILWPRTNVGRAYVVDKLSEAGAVVEVVPSYQTSDPENVDEIADELAALLVDREIDLITLASAQTARNFAKFLALGLTRQGMSEDEAKQRLPELFDEVVISSIGPETSQAATKHLGKVDVEARRFTIEGLVDAVSSYFTTRYASRDD